MSALRVSPDQSSLRARARAAKEQFEASGTNMSEWARERGCTPKLVAQLAAPIFAAFSEGRIGIDQARAFAATSDQDLQLATFTRFQRLNAQTPRPSEIRQAMAFGDEAARRELLFVGNEVYRAAGGSFELDLFAEDADERGRVTNAVLLRELVDAKLATIRDATWASGATHGTSAAFGKSATSSIPFPSRK